MANFGRVDIGLLGHGLLLLGIEFNYTNNPLHAWITVILVDVWHWTSLVVLLCYAGLQSIPSAYYQAAEIDQASRYSVFRYIELPKMTGVLSIAILLRFMDSFMIYTEPFVVTGGGPGNSTTFLSIDLVKMAIGQFDLGPCGGIFHHLFFGDFVRVLGVPYGYHPHGYIGGHYEKKPNKTRVDSRYLYFTVDVANLLVDKHEFEIKR